MQVFTVYEVEYWKTSNVSPAKFKCPVHIESASVAIKIYETDYSSLLRDRIVVGITCDLAWDRLLSEENSMFDLAIKICKSN